MDAISSRASLRATSFGQMSLLITVTTERNARSNPLVELSPRLFSRRICTLLITTRRSMLKGIDFHRGRTRGRSRRVYLLILLEGVHSSVVGIQIRISKTRIGVKDFIHSNRFVCNRDPSRVGRNLSNNFLHETRIHHTEVY